MAKRLEEMSQVWFEGRDDIETANRPILLLIDRFFDLDTPLMLDYSYLGLTGELAPDKLP